MINQKTPVAEAVATMRRQFGHRAEAICTLRRDQAEAKGQARRADMWRTILETLQGKGEPVDDGWFQCAAHQFTFGHRAVIYETTTGWEWEVFGHSRANQAATLADAKAEAQRCL